LRISFFLYFEIEAQLFEKCTSKRLENSVFTWIPYLTIADIKKVTNHSDQIILVLLKGKQSIYSNGKPNI